MGKKSLKGLYHYYAETRGDYPVLPCDCVDPVSFSRGQREAVLTEEDRPQCYNNLSEKRKDRDNEDLKEYGFVASVTGTCQTRWLEGLTNDACTTRACFSNTRQVGFLN